MPFNTTSSSNDNYYNRQNQTQSANVIAIQDAVSDAFLNAKRFTLVEREKMALIKREKKTQQSEEFIDGSTVEQSKSMGASYIVTGNIQEASFEEKQKFHLTLKLLMFQLVKLWHQKNFLPKQKEKMFTKTL